MAVPNQIQYYLAIALLNLLFANFAAVNSQAGAAGGGRLQTAARVHHGDLIDVDVIGSLEFDWRGNVSPEGFLDGFDSIEEQVFALCRTEAEVAEAVRREYSRFLRDPQIAVRILDRTKRPEAVMNGAVRNPHRFQLKREARLNELLILAGGITDVSGGEITIFRPAGSTCEVIEDGTAAPSKVSRTISIKISDLLKGAPEANPEILSGDVINVIPAWPIFVIGGVNNPLQLALRSELTVLRAVASAGGVAKEGVAGNVTIFRRVDGRSEMIEADLTKIESGSSADIPLKPFDIIDVAQKERPKRQFAPVVETENLGIAAGQQLPLRVID